jgi:hypothetical protein
MKHLTTLLACLDAEHLSEDQAESMRAVLPCSSSIPPAFDGQKGNSTVSGFLQQFSGAGMIINM